MMTTNVEVSNVGDVEVLTPGTIVFVLRAFVLRADDYQDSYFGIVCTDDFWRENAHPRAQELFRQHNSPRVPHLPILRMQEDLGWTLFFCSQGRTTPHESLLADQNKFDKYLSMLSSFTYRDGSRYYRHFYQLVSHFRNFLNGEHKPMGYPDIAKQVGFLSSLQKYREEQSAEAQKPARFHQM